jgi:hypothetical protein
VEHRFLPQQFWRHDLRRGRERRDNHAQPAITIQKYSQGGTSVLTSANGSRLTLLEPFTWVGDPSGSIIGGNAMLTANAGINFSGAGNRLVGGSTGGSVNISIAGTTTFSTGALYIAGTSLVSNSGTFNLTGGAGIAGAISGSADGTFASSGVINKAAPAPPAPSSAPSINRAR